MVLFYLNYFSLCMCFCIIYVHFIIYFTILMLHLRELN